MIIKFMDGNSRSVSVIHAVDAEQDRWIGNKYLEIP
jgi:hypothetical protein